ncbi:MAG: hypothetical protein IJS12_04180 [Lachnospiraceae bacterium]|nr:hypothetical protein [Lachnospiraceae bacterium]
MEDKQQKTYKLIYRIMLAVMVATILPLWYLGRYDVICLDDFGFGAVTHHAWVETHSAAAVFMAACEQVGYLFEVKQATYSSIFLMSFFPGIWNEKYYFLVPFILTSVTICSVSIFIHIVISDCIGVKNRYLTGIINMILIFLIIQTIPVPLEAFFWFNGAVHYVFMESVMLIEISLILHGLHNKGTGPRILCVVIASVLGIIVGGGNLITGLQACILVALFLLLFIRTDKEERRGYAMFLIPALITVACYLVNILAPGNYQRMEVETQMNPIKAIVLSFYWGISHGLTWISPMTIAAMIAVFALSCVITREAVRRYLPPLLMFVVTTCVFAAMFTPTFYATSEDAPARVKNIIYMAEILMIFINIVNACGYIQTKEVTVPDSATGFWKNMTGLCLKHTRGIVLAGITAVLLLFIFAENKNTYTSISAVRSLVKGEASRYYEQNKARSELYNDPSQPDVTIYALTDDAKPYLLFKEDVGNYDGEEGYWQNVSLCNYYDKNSITVIR